MTARPYSTVMPDNFWARVMLSRTGCWLWIGAVNRGYGHYSFPMVDGRRTQGSAHRAAYLAFVGPVPEGKDLHHTCGVKMCVNPAHLEPLTRSEHVLRHIAEEGPWQTGRQTPPPRKSHCKHGHALVDENIYIRPDNARRQCKACNRERALRRYTDRN